MVRDAFNDTADASTLNQCAHWLFESAVHKYGNKTAIICGTNAISFSDLNARANSLARQLVHRDISSGDIVGVHMDRSIDLVTALLATMKAGVAYVPIDSALPNERVKTMVADAQPKMVITDCETSEATATNSLLERGVYTNILELTCGGKPLAELENKNLDLPVEPQNLAYVMYTSGSTGRPKGVEVSHGSVANLLLSMQKRPGCSEGDRLLALTTISFDMSVVEIFLPLICGATTVLALRCEQTDPAAIIDLVARHKINIMQGTPAIWKLLLDLGWEGEPRLETIMCGGERLPRSLADRLLTCGNRCWNMYGPTEATVYACIWRIQKEKKIIVGRPIPNCRAYVLDADMLPIPHGTTGELYVAGAGVARGYRGRMDLTNAQFLEDPFNKERMYRTGDQAFVTAFGELSVLGRIDEQVKIRGHRIELGEVESIVTESPQISAAVVICREQRLFAYCVPTINSEIDRPALRRWLALRLPSYMMPAFIVEMESLPLTVNGKIDRKALPEHFESIPISSSAPQASSRQTASRMEQSLIVAWSSVLGHSQFSIHDNFFEVGGDSLRLISLQAKLASLVKRRVLVAKLFEHYTISTLAAYLTDLCAGHPSNTTLAEIPDSFGTREDIAIISMACRLPGGVTTPEEFWTLLKSGKDAINSVPVGRWGKDDRKGLYCHRGGFIPRLHDYDTKFFGISPREASKLDPAQYMMLETCWEGFERAGYTLDQLRGSRTGTYIGISNIQAHNSLTTGAIRHVSELDGYTATGSAGGTMSGRISYQLGLEGPAMTTDTACSSSLVTTHLACTALRQGECDMAISGGVSLMLNPGLHAEFGLLNGMSPDGRCRSFSDDTQGTGWAEGAAAVVLKRLVDAQRDGDLIHAVIRGSAVNHDGRSGTLTTPRGESQARLIRTALTASELQPNDIDYVEAHGTGTRLGDPIEAQALVDVFAPHRVKEAEKLCIGSVKSNIGHTQAAAGLTGLLKVVLSMKNQTIPKSLHISKPTSSIDWANANMLPVQGSRPWLSTTKRLRRAGVSAFGIGGTNAHVVLQEAPMFPQPPSNSLTSEKKPKPDRLVLFLLSAETEGALSLQVGKLHEHVRGLADGDEAALLNVAYSLATSRTHFRKRLALEVKDKDELLGKLRMYTEVGSPASFERPPPLVPTTSTQQSVRIAMLFTGQGSHWPGMGKELAQAYPVFQDTIRRVESHFVGLEVPLTNVMWADQGTSNAFLLNRTDYAQPALFALEVGLWQLWKSWGIVPHVVLGHSLGEITTAYVAGVLTLANACRLVGARAQSMQKTQQANLKMISIESTAEETKTTIEELELSDQIEIALYNSPTLTVVAGQKEGANKLADVLSLRGRKTKTLIEGFAFHSRFMDPIIEEYRAVARTLEFRDPVIKMISNLDGMVVEPGHVSHAEYWVRQIREPVRFSDCIDTLEHHELDVCLELGPRPTLCGLGAAYLGQRSEGIRPPVLWLPSLDCRNTNPNLGWDTLHSSVANIHERGVNLDWEAYFSIYDCQRVELPTYAFDRDFCALPQPSCEPCVPAASLEQCNSLRYEVSWETRHFETAPPTGTWGLLSTDTNSEWSRNVTDILSHAGLNLVRVTSLSSAEDCAALISLWDSEVDSVSEMQSCVEKALLQLQMATQQFPSPVIVWITHHAVGTGVRAYDEGMRLGTSPLWGLMRAARSEHPEIDMRLVDLVDSPDAFLLISALTQNLEPECAVRGGSILAPRMRRAEPIPTSGFSGLAEPRPFIRRDGAVLITGGLGALGKCLARWLAGQHGINDFLLTSRQGLNTPGAKDFVSEISNIQGSAKVYVQVVAGDISEPAFVRAMMAYFNKQRPLRAVFHAAGVTDSGLLSSMTPERCSATLKPKAFGAWALHEETKYLDLDVFFCFSSISGVIGMPGLANYAASNTFLDALAHARRADGLPSASTAFGTWAGEGMASILSRSAVAHLKQLGLNSLTPDQGLQIVQISASSLAHPLTVTSAIDLQQLKSYMTSRGGTTALLRSLMDGGEPKLSPSISLQDILSRTGKEEHLDIVLSTVRSVVAQSLGHSQTERLAIDCSLQDIGIDSLTAVQTRNHLAKLTGLQLSVNVVFHHRTLQALSQFLLSKLSEGMSASAATVPSEVESNAILSSESFLIDTNSICRGVLDDRIMFPNVLPNPDSSPTTPTSVLLTGATGFVGCFILSDLLRKGVVVHAIVRSSDFGGARDRLVNGLQKFELWEPDFEPLLQPVRGDISKPLLGLSYEQFDGLAGVVDCVCHSGALVDWMRPLSDYVGPNIISTHEVLRLASHGRPKSIHVISTMSTLPKHLGFDLTENDAEYGYGTSKYVAERLVSAARWRGAKASVYRLPYVTASTTTGCARADRGDFLHNLIVGSLRMRAFPSLDDADMSAVLPVDYLSKTIVDLMTENVRPRGRDYDFRNIAAPTCNSFFEEMGNGSVPMLQFGQWKQMALEEAERYPTGPLARISAVLDSFTDETASKIFKALSVGEHVLGGTYYPAPLLGTKFICIYRNRMVGDLNA